MASEEPNPGGFISISSSEDERPPPKKKRALRDDDTPSASAVDDSLADRPKRARVSSSAGSISDAKVSEEGEINENEAELDDDADGQTPAESGADRNSAGTPGVFLPQDPPLYDSDSLAFRLPVFSRRREGSWFTRFKDWVQVFYSSNSHHAASLTPALVSAAYIRYIDSHSGLKQSKKRGAKQAATKLDESGSLSLFLQHLQSSGEHQQHGDAGGNPYSQPSHSTEPAQNAQASGSGANDIPNQPIAIVDSVYVVDTARKQNSNAGLLDPSSQNNGSNMAHKEGVPTGEDALAQQRRYFPSASDPTSMCLLCGREGHIATLCTQSFCKFCGEDDHSTFVCSTIQTRCSKCKQLGHTSKGCVEKLALTKDEGLSCLYCNARDHLENECTQVWRSFHPEAGTIKTIINLPPTCAVCGDGQHYSADCQQRSSQPRNPTWSLENQQKYIDTSCNVVAIEESHSGSGKTKTKGPSDLKIRGQASRTHVHYSESEDSEVEFLGQRPASNKARIGQIRVASNIQMPNGKQQPPLPPGPPPPTLPRYPPPPGVSSNGFVQATAPPPSLPSKPPATRNYQNVPPPPPPPPSTNDFRGGFGRGRGGSRGRGGRGGRGGPRGRGRGK